MKTDESFNNEFEYQLRDAGYKWFRDHWKGSVRGFQRRIVDEYGIRYFITGYHWDFSKFLNYNGNPDSYSFDCQFTLNNDATVDVKFSGSFLPNEHENPAITLSEVEAFYDKFWWDNMCNYYEKF